MEMTNPPNGGWGWMVVLGAALINMVNQAMFSVFGLVFGEELKKLANGKAIGITLVMAVSVMVTNFSGLIVGPLMRRISVRTITFFGIFCTGCGMIISSFATRIFHVIIGYGIFTGLGLGLLASSTFLAINEHFTTKKSTAVGLAMAGTSIGQMLMPTFVGLLLKSYQYSGTTFALGLLSFTGFIGALFFRKPPVVKNEDKSNLDINSNSNLSQFKENNIRSSSPTEYIKIDSDLEDSKVLSYDHDHITHKEAVEAAEYGVYLSESNDDECDSENDMSNRNKTKSLCDLEDNRSETSQYSNVDLDGENIDIYYNELYESKNDIKPLEESTNKNYETLVENAQEQKNTQSDNLISETEISSEYFSVSEPTNESSIAALPETDHLSHKSQISIHENKSHSPKKELEEEKNKNINTVTIVAPKRKKKKKKLNPFGSVDSVDGKRPKSIFYDPKLNPFSEENQSRSLSYDNILNPFENPANETQALTGPIRKSNFYKKYYASYDSLKNPFREEEAQALLEEKRARIEQDNKQIEPVMKNGYISIAEIDSGTSQSNNVNTSSQSASPSASASPSMKPKRNCFHEINESLNLSLLADMSFVHILIGLALGYTSSVTFSTFFPMFLQDEIGFNMDQTTWSMTALSLADVIGRITISFICRKLHFDSKMSFMIAALITGLCRSSLVELSTVNSVYVASFTTGYFRAATVINQNLVISEYIHKDKLPSAVGLNMVFKGLSVITIGQLFGLLKEYISYAACIHILDGMLFAIVLSWSTEMLIKQKTKKQSNT